MQELLHFTADWCQPCKKMAPMIDEFISNNPEIIYTKIDVDTDSAFVEEYEIRGVPTFIIKNDGEVVNRHTGVATADKFATLFN
jgi:thiol-disulfide isomerase/thioredoxin